MSWWVVWGWVLLGASVGWGQGVETQDGGDVPTLAVTARLVGVPATVRDKAGKIQVGLGKGDFELKEDGKVQEIKYFSVGSELPLTVALLIDTSGSQRQFIGDETKASELFFQSMVKRPEDRAALVQFDTAVLELQGLTGKVGELEAALGRLTTDHPPSGANVNGGGTLLYDAVSRTCFSVLRNQAGRRAMVLLTDGDDRGSRYTLGHAVAEALMGDVIVYSVLYDRGESIYGGSRKGLDTLETLSKATGGRVFTVANGESLATIYGEIAEELRLQYQIGYRPPESGKMTFHRVELKAKDKKLKVQAREGYYTLK